MRNYSILALFISTFVQISAFTIHHGSKYNTRSLRQNSHLCTPNNQIYTNAFTIRRNKIDINTSSSITSRRMSTAVLDAPTPNPSASSFHQRMRNIVVAPPKKRIRRTKKKSVLRPDNLFVANTLDDYKLLVGDETDKIVVVRFFATWCKACQAIGPSFYRLAKQHKHIKFVEVPVTDRNAELHQGLAVPSLPFGHVYHPVGGLVEEMRISRKYFKEFEGTVQNYVDGSCDILEDEGVLQ